MLIIFDVDGTLIGGESIDWKCFDDAFLDVTGFPFSDGFFATIDEVTAKAIVHQALPQFTSEARHQTEKLVCIEYLKRLKRAHALDANSFKPAPGALEVLKYLNQQDDLAVAIATGDWIETISFKLGAAEIDISQYPMATSSDCYARADIIRLSAERAGHSLEDAIYVGDGLWDFRATQKLGIPFLGVGHRYSEFLDIGVVHALQTLEPAAFSTWFHSFKNAEQDAAANP